MFNKKLYFAPMEGITGYVFRNAYAAVYGGMDAYFTPFLSNPVLNQIELHDVLPEHNEGIGLVPQIIANRVESFVQIAETLKDYGYSEVNLNLGCPSGTVVAKGRGSGALREPRELRRLLDGIYEKSPLPVSVKCRVGISSETEWEDILEVLVAFPLKELIIHPRLQKEFYKGNVHMDAFRLAYDRVLEKTEIPLCYNGDLYTVEDMLRITEEFPGITALMLGRGILQNPELPHLYHKNCNTEGANTHCHPDNKAQCCHPEGAEQPKDPLTTAAPPGQPGESADSNHLRIFLDLLCDGYKKEMDREGPALMKLKELWKYLQVYTGRSFKEMRPLWKARTLAEYRDVVNMLL